MNKAPAFQFYPDDWLSCEKVSTMPPDCEGAYIRLLAYAWRAEDCGLPGDDEALAILSRLNDQWMIKGVKYVRPCFYEKDGRLFNKRLMDERKKQEHYRKERSISGLKGAKSKWLSHSSAITSNMAQPMANDGSSSSSSSSSSSPKEEKSKKHFVPPTLDEVIEYVMEKSYGFDPESFIAHYEATGWVRGRTPIKNWKACCTTWQDHYLKGFGNNKPEVKPAWYGAK